MDPSPPGSLLAPTRVGLHLGRLATRVEALGRVQDWPEGATLCHRGARDRDLHVLLGGELAYPGGTLGPGSHAGELGFLLGVPRTADLVARLPSRTWSAHAEAMARDPEAATTLIAALVRELPKRLRKFSVQEPADDAFCDHGHPAILTLASALRGPDDEATAAAIWSFVRDLPYRFGPWWQKASDTLRAGWGMCTTKSNLEVALFRAAGLEAGFVELEIDAAFVEPLIPAPWRARVKRHTRHYMGAVALGRRWHVADCSFTDATLLLLAEHYPVLREASGDRLATGRPYHPTARMRGSDPFGDSVIPSLTRAMARRSSFDLEQHELLNLVTDAVQPTIIDEPAWLIRARALQATEPVRAMHMALAAAAVLAADLRDRIMESA